MTHKEIYDLTTGIHKSEAMQNSSLCPEGAIQAVNILRQNVKTLIKTIHECYKDREDIKKVADMYKRIDTAKEVIFIDAVNKKLEKDWDSITSSDARNGETVTASLNNVSTKTVDNTLTLDDCIAD